MFEGQCPGSLRRFPSTFIHSLKALTQVTAAILAGGLGTRLRSVVADRPKVLAPVRGRPFIEYLLEQLADAGVPSAVLCTGYMGEMVQTALGTRFRDVSLIYSREEQSLGTAGALRLAAPLIESEWVLVLNGDSYCKASLEAFAGWHMARRSMASLLLVQVDDTSRYGRVRTDEQGSVIAFDEKSATSGPGWVNGGIYLIHRSWLDDIPSHRPVSLEREIFPAWTGRGLHGYASDAQFCDIGVPEAYARANGEFSDIR